MVKIQSKNLNGSENVSNVYSGDIRYIFLTNSVLADQSARGAQPSVVSTGDQRTMVASVDQSPPEPDHKTIDPNPHIYPMLDVNPILPKGGDLSALANVDPGLASDLYLYAIGVFNLTSPNTKSDGGGASQPSSGQQPATPQTSAPSGGFTITISGSGATYTINTASPKASGAESTTSEIKCVYVGPRNGVPAPHSAVEAFSYIDANSADNCNADHKLELAKSFISISDKLCQQFITNMDVDQRGYKSAFSIFGSIFGFVGTVISPAKVFSGLAGVSTSIDGDLNSGAFHGEEAYLLGNAIISSQAEDRVALYGRLGIAAKPTTAANSTSSTSAPSTTTTASATGEASAITITLIPAMPGAPSALAKPVTTTAQSKPGSTVAPAKPDTQLTSPSIMLAFGGAATADNAKGAASSANGNAADLKTASIGTIYTEINNYHSGCSVRSGLNQLLNKLNTTTPVKTTPVPST